MGYETHVGSCNLCKHPVLIDDVYYKIGETLLEGILCEECMDDIHKCERCGITQPYCNDCV